MDKTGKKPEDKTNNKTKPPVITRQTSTEKRALNEATKQSPSIKLGDHIKVNPAKGRVALDKYGHPYSEKLATAVRVNPRILTQIKDGDLIVVDK